MKKAAFFVLLSALVAFPPSARGDQFSDLQEKIYAALKRQGTISSETQLITMTHVCTLQYDGKMWPVINTIEQIRGAQVPRGQNQIVILDSKLNVVRTISYADQYPLFCKGNHLFVQGDLGVDNTAPYGNVLSFFGNVIIASSVKGNDLPVERTGQRKTYLLK